MLPFRSIGLSMPSPSTSRLVALASVVAALAATLLGAAPTVGATDASRPMGGIDAPLFVHETSDGHGDGMDGAELEAAAFAAPPNEDFAFAFDASVDAQTRQVLETAAGIWSGVIETVRPIDVDVRMEALGPGLLGAAGPTSAYFGRLEFPEPDVLYPIGLANQMIDDDLEPDRGDIQMTLATTIDWDKSIDGSADGQSMLAVALHELGHGLGLTSWVRQEGNDFAVTYRVQGVTVALAYDVLVEQADGTSITDLGTAALNQALVGRLVWGGAAATAANGAPIPLYTPSSFQSGSSIGHLDEAAFGSALMTPFLSQDEPHTAIDEITRGLLEDIGWTTSSGQDAPDGEAVVDEPPVEDEPVTDVDRAEAFVEAVTTDFVGRAPTPSELTRWSDHVLSGGDRALVTQAFAFSDEWVGVIVEDFYLVTLGRGSEPKGKAHWVGVIKDGTPPAEVASFFYASDEYHTRSGGTDEAWIGALYRDVLGREADAGARSFWAARAASLGRTVVAFEIFQAEESRERRVTALYAELLGRGVEAGGLAYWAEVLTNGRDVDLALFLAASDEYFARAADRFA